MTNFSYIKALEAEVADLKAEIVELSARLPASDDRAGRADDDGEGRPAALLVTALSSILFGLLAGRLLGGRGRLLG